jgi:hypothetical protein
MFNWDKDLETLYERSDFSATFPETTPKSRRRLMLLSALGVIVVLGGAFYAVQSGLWARFGASTGGTQVAEPLVLPDGLTIYGPQQYANFLSSVAGFDDAQLSAHAEAAAGQLRVTGDPMRPYWVDTLFLTNRELSRRGLPTVAMPREATGPMIVMPELSR